jgi:hypothetical protein
MNGDTLLEATLRRLRISAAAYRCEWPSPVGVGEIVVGPEFFVDAPSFAAGEVVVIHSLPVGGCYHPAGGPVGSFLRITRTA